MSVLTAFNTQLVRFFEELSSTFPEEREIKMAVEAISAARKINPRLVLDMFYEHVYKDNAQAIYNKDIQSIITSANKKILTQFNDYMVALTIFNKHWHNMSENNQETVLNYLTVICKLCERARAA
jgi:hypothetical protein